MLAPVPTLHTACALCCRAPRVALCRRHLAQLQVGPAGRRRSGMALAASGSGLGEESTASEDAAGQPTASGHASADGGPLVQYVVLRRDLWAELGWPLGSVVAQACHASTAALWLSREQAEAAAYCAPGNLDHMHKVVLEVKGEAQLAALAGRLAEAGVRHKLWVEQPEGVPTCLATAPAPKAAVQPHFKKLKLCRGS